MGKIRKKKEAGFTLIEALVVLVIIGILATGAVILLGFIGDAKTAEAKNYIGNVWTGLQACAQAKIGTVDAACTSTNQFGKAGLTVGGISPDARWDITSGAETLSMDTKGVYTLSAPIIMKGVKADNKDIEVNFDYTNGDNPPGSFTCKIPPAAAASPC